MFKLSEAHLSRAAASRHSDSPGQAPLGRLPTRSKQADLTCGKMRTRGCPQSGESGGRGSVSNTSRMALSNCMQGRAQHGGHGSACLPAWKALQEDTWRRQ